ELKRIQSEPPTDSEVKEAKIARVQSLPGQFETTAATASAMASIFIYDRPLDYYANLPEAYSAVTSDGVAKAARTHVHPDHLLPASPPAPLLLVALGDRQKIEPGLKEPTLPPIEPAAPPATLIKAPKSTPAETKKPASN